MRGCEGVRETGREMGMTGKRVWEVSIINEAARDDLRDPGTVAYKFRVVASLPPDQLEDIMYMELLKAIRDIKGKMIMEGMDVE